MTDFSVRSDNVDVEQIMRQIRSRIREKRGVDYTEEEIRELANVKLEKFLDPRGVRSDLLEQFRRTKAAMPAPPNFAFEDSTIYESHRGFLRFMRRLLNPILKLFFNPNPLIHALHIQSELNTRNARREDLDALHYEVMHNLVVELTRLGIEVKNLTMRVESMSSRLDFDERRARALEGVVQYRPGSAAPQQPPTGASEAQGDAETAEQRRTRRRRRRGRRRGPSGSSDNAQHFREGGSEHADATDTAEPSDHYREANPASRPADAPEGSSGRHGGDTPASAPAETSGRYGGTTPESTPARETPQAAHDHDGPAANPDDRS